MHGHTERDRQQAALSGLAFWGLMRMLGRRHRSDRPPGRVRNVAPQNGDIGNENTREYPVLTVKLTHSCPFMVMLAPIPTAHLPPAHSFRGSRPGG